MNRYSTTADLGQLAEGRVSLGPIAATKRVTAIDRQVCRRAFEQRFTAERMVERHVSVYAQIIHAKATEVPVAI